MWVEDEACIVNSTHTTLVSNPVSDGCPVPNRRPVPNGSPVPNKRLI